LLKARPSQYILVFFLLTKRSPSDIFWLFFLNLLWHLERFLCYWLKSGGSGLSHHWHICCAFCIPRRPLQDVLHVTAAVLHGVLYGFWCSLIKP
jgi:hypothetical protein